MIRITTLGTPNVSRGGVSVSIPAKQLAVLVYLTLADKGGIQRRDELLAVFWPESDAERARAVLRQTIYGLRQTLGTDIIVSRGGEEIGVLQDEVSCDVLEYERALATNPASVALQEHRPFLNGFHLDGCPVFEMWVQKRRDRLRRSEIDVLRDLADRATHNGEGDAIKLWRRLTYADPLDGRAMVALIHAFIQHGEPWRALADYESYVTRLQTEWDLTPDPRVVAAIEEARALTKPAPMARGEELENQNAGPPSLAVGVKRQRRVLLVAGLTFLIVVLAVAVESRKTRVALRPNYFAVFPARVIAPEPDAYLETAVPYLLDAALDGAGELSTVDRNRLLPMIERSGGGVPSVEAATRYTRALGASLFVLSNVTRVDTTLQISVRVYTVDADRGPLASAEVAGSESHLQDLVHTLASAIVSQHAAGESSRLSDVSAVRASSYPALKAYLQGVHTFRVDGALAAVRSFDRAIAEDPAFALAWYRKSVAEGWANHAGARESIRHAREWSHQLSERDSLFVEAWYAMWWGDPDRTDSLTRLITQTYSNHVEAWHARGKYLQFFGWRHGYDPSVAEAAFRRALELDAGHPPALWGLGVVLNKMRRPADGWVYLDRWSAANNPTRGGPGAIIRAILMRDAAGDSVLARLTDLPPAEVAFATQIVASAQSFTGAEMLARSLTEPARPSEFHAIGELHLAHLAAARGRWMTAEQHFANASSLYPQTALVYRAMLLASPFLDRNNDDLKAARDSVRRWSGRFDEDVSWGLQVPPILRPHVRTYLLGLLEGRMGNAAAADRYADSLLIYAKRADSLALLSDLALELRALSAVARGDSQAALTELERSQLTVRFNHWVSAFHKRWFGSFLRAELLFEAERDDEALGWYSGFGPGNESVDYVHFPWSELRRGQIFERVGRPDSAIVHYRVFVENWGNADAPYRHIVEDVASRLTRLTAARP